MKKVGLIIQGPFVSIGKSGQSVHQKLYASSPELVRYDCRSTIQGTIRDFGELFDAIVVSTWGSEVKPGDQWEGATIVAAPDPGAPMDTNLEAYKADNRNRQFIGIQNGLRWLEQNTDVEYVVRVRTDQYLNLKELLGSFERQLKSARFMAGMICVPFIRPGISHASDMYFVSRLESMKRFLEVMLSHGMHEFIQDVHRDMALKYAHAEFRDALGVPEWAYFPRQPSFGVNKESKKVFRFMYHKVFAPLSKATLRSVVFRGSPLSGEYLKAAVVEETTSSMAQESRGVLSKISVPALLSIDWERYFAFRHIVKGGDFSRKEKLMGKFGKIGWQVWVGLQQIYRKKRAEVLLLFALALVFHSSVAFFLYVTEFQPFTGGDYNLYHDTATTIAERISQGVFSFEDMFIPHAYPVIVGVLYFLTVPSMLVGQLFNALLAALSVVLLYFLAREAGVPKTWAFVVGLVGMVYPSFVFFGDLLLKEGVVTLLTLAALWVSLRMLKGFSWRQAFLLLLLATLLVHFRVYMGMILIAVFLVSWFLFSLEPPRTRAFAGFVLFFLFGFAPSLNGYGYYGVPFIISMTNADKIRFYKEEVYSPANEQAGLLKQAVPEGSGLDTSSKNAVAAKKERTKASVDYLTTGFENPATFLWNYVRSFALASLGPFPWHFKTASQAFTLLETVPWWVMVAVGMKGAWEEFRKRRRNPVFLLLLFSLVVFGVLALYFNNFGILMRVRVPAFLVLLPFVALAFPYIRTLVKRA